MHTACLYVYVYVYVYVCVCVCVCVSVSVSQWVFTQRDKEHARIYSGLCQ